MLAVTPSALMAHYLYQGRHHGHSPNPLFDEEWYIKTYEDAAYEVRIGHLSSGFDHYCMLGYAHVSPHWLFDLRYYRQRYDDLTLETLDRLGVANHYAHFLRYGAQEGRIAHRFFWPKYYWAGLETEQRSLAMEQGIFLHFLSADLKSGREVPTTPYFSPGWYRETYTQVDADIRAGLQHSALRHYLTNETPTAFDPNFIFSEENYLSRNDDVARAVANGKIRSGYQHFITNGVCEKRFFSRIIDLDRYTNSHALVRADLGADPAMDPYLHLLTIGTALGLAANSQPAPGSGSVESQLKIQFRAEAQVVALAYAHSELDFAPRTPPAVSVIMVGHNRFALTFAALASLRDNFHAPIELIFIDSGSTDETMQIETWVKGFKLIRLAHNVGFVSACNTGLQEVTSETVLFLNNDVRLASGAVASAIRRLGSSSDIGAVGGKILRAHGLLQEAGCSISWDGSTTGYLRDHDPLEPAANYVREVDYCSAVFLLLPSALARALGGFDIDYVPSYYEDTDLCVRLQQLGFRVVYDPSIVVHHLEYGSLQTTEEADMAMARGRQTFLRKHRNWLERQPEPKDQFTAAEARRTGSQRILFLDDTIPVREMGSGFVRANDIIGEMTALGYAVTVFPINPCTRPVVTTYSQFPDSANILYNRTIDDLPAFLDEHRRYFDIVWVSRTHNLRLVQAEIRALQDPLGRPVRVILDTEALASERDRTKLRIKPASSSAHSHGILQAEFHHVAPDSHVVCVNEAEQTLLQAQGLTKLSILGHFRRLALTPAPFEDRHGILILGALHEVDTPNYDALFWFVEEILPLIQKDFDVQPLVSVAGYVSANIDLSALDDHPHVRLLGCVSSTWSLYNDHRIFVAPTRFAAGIPYKIHEAASFGLPIVTTSLIAGQIGWGHGAELLAASQMTPRDFAQQVVTLYNTSALWKRLRLYAARRLMQENNQADYRRALNSILTDIGLKTGEATENDPVPRSLMRSSKLSSVRTA